MFNRDINAPVFVLRYCCLNYSCFASNVGLRKSANFTSENEHFWVHSLHGLRQLLRSGFLLANNRRRRFLPQRPPTFVPYIYSRDENRIKESGDIFFGESDRNWILEGATVHVSMVGFDDGSERNHILDGRVRPQRSTVRQSPKRRAS